MHAKQPDSDNKLIPIVPLICRYLIIIFLQNKCGDLNFTARYTKSSWQPLFSCSLWKVISHLRTTKSKMFCMEITDMGWRNQEMVSALSWIIEFLFCFIYHSASSKDQRKWLHAPHNVGVLMVQSSQINCNKQKLSLKFQPYASNIVWIHFIS